MFASGPLVLSSPDLPFAAPFVTSPMCADVDGRSQHAAVRVGGRAP
jgi:hypothetical protein